MTLYQPGAASQGVRTRKGHRTQFESTPGAAKASRGVGRTSLRPWRRSVRMRLPTVPGRLAGGRGLPGRGPRLALGRRRRERGGCSERGSRRSRGRCGPVPLGVGRGVTRAPRTGGSNRQRTDETGESDPDRMSRRMSSLVNEPDRPVENSISVSRHGAQRRLTGAHLPYGDRDQHTERGQAPAFLLRLLTVIWPWWAWQEGGYFASVLPPGVGPLNGSPRAALRGLQGASIGSAQATDSRRELHD